MSQDAALTLQAVSAELRLELMDKILEAAREDGLRGFGGECFAAAVAINRVLFQGEGVLAIGVNEALFDQGRALGHAVVRLGDEHWDADGRPKTEDEVECWGMLDPEDTDYREMAEEHGIPWDEEAAATAAVFEFDDEGEFLERLQPDEETIDSLCALLQKAAHPFLERAAQEKNQPAGEVRP